MQSRSSAAHSLQFESVITSDEDLVGEVMDIPIPGAGLSMSRVLSQEGHSPFDSVEWETRDAAITDGKGNTVFAQTHVEAPKAWSSLATNIVASKYFYGSLDEDKREYSVRHLVHRVSRTISDWGRDRGTFATREDADVFYDELCAICVEQYGAFNSPVWFNVGLHQEYDVSSKRAQAYRWCEAENRVMPVDDAYQYPQVSACFIQSVKDTLDDIMRLASAEAKLFKYGSGSGTDLSTLRSRREKLSGGGTPSGPLSFMRVFDQVAGVVKSGGKTRRAAKMQSLKVNHPDIMEFITCKTDEDRKARALIEQGYDASMDGDAYGSVQFQNANLSVRVSDAFMEAVEQDTSWDTHAVVSGETVETLSAREVMQRIAESAHACGDPGLQYETTINAWHTCADTSRINASNPCSEYMFVDDSACNLASVNLMKFVDASGAFDTRRFQHVVRTLFIAQEILVDSASYPTEEIALNSHRYRPLGLGYANLGALLMNLGLPYDSDTGRNTAAAISALLTGYAYATSAELAGTHGPFDTFEDNRESMMHVIHKHQSAVKDIDAALCPPGMAGVAREVWDYVAAAGASSGFRNAQATVLAPTGTIGFMMDCDTTGVEPDIALVKYKQMAGGGMMKIVNQSVAQALKRHDYADRQIDEIVAYLHEQDTIEGAPLLREEDLPIFDCAFKPANGERFIRHTAHLGMMSAVQPFISGAISKTINMPSEASPDDIMQVYMDGWKMGLKAVAVYRDGSKAAQPLSTRTEEPAEAGKPYRRRMPTTRQSVTHRFEIGGHEGYLTVGLYEDGKPGELFITMAKEGSTVGGLMDAFGTAISLCLQYGVPLRVLCRKFSHTRFEPSGFTKDPEIPMAKSLVDYIFRWLENTFPEEDAQNGDSCADTVSVDADPVSLPQDVEGAADVAFQHFMQDAPICDQCGAITVRNGSCYRCHNCGNSMGCS